MRRDANLHRKDPGLQAAIAAAGSVAALARAIGRPQQTVNDWVHRGKPLPAEYVLTVESELGVPRHVSRPDLYDAPPVSEVASDRLEGVRP